MNSILKLSPKYKTVLQILFVLMILRAESPENSYAQKPYILSPEPRIKYTLNEDWKFYPDGVAFGQRSHYRGIRQNVDNLWESVSLPHTWNTLDPFDDQESYRRCISWYRKEIWLDNNLKNKRLFLYFEGVNQKADVYVNGTFVGNHKGGYTAFVFDITDFVQFDNNENKNLIAVQVDNSHDNTIPPLSMGYALYGGIYRDVWLIATEPVHIKVTDFASSGVYITTPEVSREKATVNIRGTIVNLTDEEQKIQVVNTIVDAEGIIIQQTDSKFSITAGHEEVFRENGVPVKFPHLWSPDAPYLYAVYTEVTINDRVVDRVKNPLGFRWFLFDADKGFYLNGEKIQIYGTNRHQDYKGLGHALTNVQHERDMEWIKNMGANFVRLAHYPQDPVVLETADLIGLLVWEEIPLVNYINLSKEFFYNTKNMLREMIRQHYNHPSVILWGCMNEILLWSKEGKRISTNIDSTYLWRVRDLVYSLDSLARTEDQKRFTVLAMHNSKIYEKVGIDEIPQVSAWNVYFGWYGGTWDQFGVWLDRKHNENLHKKIFISEYGAGSDVRLNGINPQSFDFTGNWQRLFHESYLKQINERPYLAGTAIWNQFDFSQPHTGGSISHLNQKGMQTWDRKPKDVYYLYKANWNHEPMIYIASRDWTRRCGTDPEAHHDKVSVSVKQNIDVYSNLEIVELFYNGLSLGKKRPNEIKKASWHVRFEHGINVIEAIGEKQGKLYKDIVNIQFTYIPTNLKDPSVPFRKLAVNLGYGAEFVDQSGLIWLPDKPYKKGSFGHTGGKSCMINKDLIVCHCGELAPLYNYYQEGLDAYCIDIPDGVYKIELHFVEPEDLGYGERVFNVIVNDREIFRELDLSKKYGFLKAVRVSHIVSVSDNRGLKIEFQKIKREPILNALYIERK